MKKELILGSAILAATIPAAATAASPNWTYVEISYVGSSDFFQDDGADVDPYAPDFDVDFHGAEIAGSAAITDWMFVTGSYSYQGSDDIDFGYYVGSLNLDLERLTLGIGANLELTETTDIYGKIAHEDWTMSVDDYDLDIFEENGYSYSIGIRSIVADRLELIAEVGQVDIDYIFDKEFRYMAGAYYSVTENIVLGANYTSVDDFDTFKATFRYQF